MSSDTLPYNCYDISPTDPFQGLHVDGVVTRRTLFAFRGTEQTL